MKNNAARQQLPPGNSPPKARKVSADGERTVPEKQETGCTLPLLLKVKEVTRLLGGVHPRTVTRLEKRGLIRPVTGLIRHKLYLRSDVVALVKCLSEWHP